VPDFPFAFDPYEVERLRVTGMLPSLHARLQPERVSIYSRRGSRTFAEVDDNANRLVAALTAAGIRAGDHVALLAPNTPEFVEVYAGMLRSGLRLTPVNWHLKAEEVAYVVTDSDAKALIAHADFAAAAAMAGQSEALMARLAIGGSIDGFDDYAAVLARQSAAPPQNPSHGLMMLYTSGTTGRPKGVFRATPEPRPAQWGPDSRKQLGPGDTVLALGPAYHSAPLGHSIADPLAAGVPIVLTEKFDAEQTLALIQEHRVTHVHMVSVMFQRLLALPEAVRTAYDLSSLRYVIHGAAPTPPEIKRAMIEWWGPILHEYYGASEGSSGFYITPEEWHRKPGSVGRRRPDVRSRVVDDQDRDCAPGEIGRVFFPVNPSSPFSYYKDDAKTQSILLDGTHFTVGDMGYLDADDYLFLTGRTAECIISGGVNIYPQEIDNELAQHPAVAEVCTVGAPSEEWGEEVRALAPGGLGDA
jgi:long-chain acyl-CoA synthetase